MIQSHNGWNGFQPRLVVQNDFIVPPSTTALSKHSNSKLHQKIQRYRGRTNVIDPIRQQQKLLQNERYRIKCLIRNINSFDDIASNYWTFSDLKKCCLYGISKETNQRLLDEQELEQKVQQEAQGDYPHLSSFISYLCITTHNATNFKQEEEALLFEIHAIFNNYLSNYDGDNISDIVTDKYKYDQLNSRRYRMREKFKKLLQKGKISEMFMDMRPFLAKIGKICLQHDVCDAL